MLVPHWGRIIANTSANSESVIKVIEVSRQVSDARVTNRCCINLETIRSSTE